MTNQELLELVNKNIKELSLDTFNVLETLMDYTLEANDKFNLTAIKDKEKFRELMIYDSLLPLKYISFDNKSVLDIGTGAGFPGLPLALASQGQFTLLDATAKKINHINNFVKENSLSNVIGVASRAEEFIQNKRDMFDISIARAVSQLNVLLELAIPFIKENGIFIALKSNKYNEELLEAKEAIKKLNIKVENIFEDELPISKEKRYLIAFRKIGPTNKKYPREYGEIKRKPL